MHFNKFLALAAAIAAPAAALAPLYEDRQPSTTLIPGKFVVKLKNDISTDTASEIESLMDEVDYFYNLTSFKGLAGKLDDAALESVQAHPGVDYVERDVLLPACNYVSQHGAPWGLGRISHKGLRSFTDNTTYVYEASAGEGVCAYVLDTGIRVDHEEFGGRAEFLANFAGGEDNDINGHGTHVAGTIGGATCGVAKKVRLYSVKVLHEQLGELSDLLQGMEFVANDSQTRHCPNGTVANISLGG
ncbi:hypothetical protein SLS64_000251 [Diaporthe eres]